MTRTDKGLRLRRLMMPALTAVLVATVATAMSAGQRGGHDDDDEQGDSDGHTYAIGLWGDFPYSDTQALIGVPNLIADMNSHLEADVASGRLTQAQADERKADAATRTADFVNSTRPARPAGPPA